MEHTHGQQSKKHRDSALYVMRHISSAAHEKGQSTKDYLDIEQPCEFMDKDKPGHSEQDSNHLPSPRSDTELALHG